MAPLTSYRAAYDKIASAQCSPNEFEDVKLRFDSEINSKRCSAAITSIPQLLRVLEKRDCLGPDNVDALLDIATVVRDPSILQLLQSHADTNTTTSAPVTTCPVLPSPYSDPKKRIYRLIADEIGVKWMDFARALDIREGHIDDLSRTYPRIPDRVYEILKYHEENCQPQFWRTNLQEALTTARRNDLKKDVQHIFDTH